MKDNIRILKDPSDNLYDVSSEGASIIVHWDKNRELIEYTLQGSEGNGVVKQTAEGPNITTAIKYCQELHSSFIHISKNIRKSRSWGNIYFHLMGIGQKIKSYFLSDTIIQFIDETISDGGILKIHTNEFFIPWEIIYNPHKKYFFGEKFIIVKDILQVKNPNLSNYSKKKKYRSKLSNVVHVIGNQTGNTLHFKKMLNDILKKGQLQINNPEHNQYYSVSDIKYFLQTNSDIVHFSCHAKLDNTGERYLQLGPHPIDNHLYAHMLSALDISNKIIFINACSSMVGYGNDYGNLSDLASFGWLVSNNGSSAIIGTIAPILASSASEFATLFYENFLNHQHNIGEALLSTKYYYKSEGCPLGLFYTLYGDNTLIKKTK
jgi:hypothetical protein